MQGEIHIAGIGGVGMSALAQALLDQGEPVSGSDRLLDAGDETDTLACLAAQGVRLCRQDGSGVTPHTARLVVSTAIEPDNPEVLRAQALGVPIVHRAAELARLTAGRRLIAVTGTCGKSTVTAMLGCLLEGAGFDPLVVNGAAVAGWSADGTRIGSVRKGAGEWAVIEADESDRSLMVFSPEHAIITNASADHFALAETLSLFAAFRERVPGTVIDGRDADGGPEGARTEGWGGYFRFEGIGYRVPMPGLHNVHNAWHAVRMARALGAAPGQLAAALAAFGGVERRLQRVGRCGAATVVDDYAHNPEKLAAAWTTLAAAFPAGVCAVWRPHGYAPLRKMLEGLAQTFAAVCRPQDTLLLLPVYDAGGTADRSVSSDVLAFLLHEKDVKVTSVGSLDDAETIMRAHAAVGGVLATLGARDPGLPRLARRLVVSG
ncbi:MAG TPA: Mur ligase domain-containing protein [Kiritimatiellia bacterium]|nr:Mur ligase domain-containing protein [Kiritimatiellia bacterium]HRU71481.1 Mur ligase domain-containing protein [Kiritimatiellia bacterium]